MRTESSTVQHRAKTFAKFLFISYKKRVCFVLNCSIMPKNYNKLDSKRPTADIVEQYNMYHDHVKQALSGQRFAAFDIVTQQTQR